MLLAGFVLLAGGQQGIEVHKAHEIQPYQSHEIKLDNPKRGPLKDPKAYFCKTFALRVKGATWVTENVWNHTRTLHVGPGTGFVGWIELKSDGTYRWNSSWDGHLVKGRWTFEKGGQTVNIANGQEGKDWRLQASYGTKDRYQVLLDDRNYVVYEGRATKAKK